MSDRIQTIGGIIETISRKGEGTVIKVSWESAHEAEGDIKGSQ